MQGRSFLMTTRTQYLDERYHRVPNVVDLYIDLQIFFISSIITALPLM